MYFLCIAFYQDKCVRQTTHQWRVYLYFIRILSLYNVRHFSFCQTSVRLKFGLLSLIVRHKSDKNRRFLEPFVHYLSLIIPPSYRNMYKKRISITRYSIIIPIILILTYQIFNCIYQKNIKIMTCKMTKT